MSNFGGEKSETNAQSSRRRYTSAPSSYVLETSLDEEWEKQRLKTQGRRRPSHITNAVDQERQRMNKQTQD
ncbi:MAG: hypothetical protein NPIRA04_13010 [Nitrospirales bacterium]|nr:MAG: hypothetical protein NPIRA04_13010 [Nitrospirales bacterium]